MPTTFYSVLNHLDQYNCGPGGICIDERGTPNRVKASQLVATGLSVVLSRLNTYEYAYVLNMVTDWPRVVMIAEIGRAHV